MTEEIKYDPTSGRNLSNGTWEYKVPASKDIPCDIRISFLRNNPNITGVLGSKSCFFLNLDLKLNIILLLTVLILKRSGNLLFACRCALFSRLETQSKQLEKKWEKQIILF